MIDLRKAPENVDGDGFCHYEERWLDIDSFLIKEEPRTYVMLDPPHEYLIDSFEYIKTIQHKYDEIILDHLYPINLDSKQRWRCRVRSSKDISKNTIVHKNRTGQKWQLCDDHCVVFE